MIDIFNTIAIKLEEWTEIVHNGLHREQLTDDDVDKFLNGF